MTWIGPTCCGSLFLLEREFENVALAEALEFFDFIVVARDQAALHSQIADRALKFALGGFQIRLGGGNIAFGAA